MKKILLFMVCFLMSWGAVRAQTDVEEDSVEVSGVVYNVHTGQAEPLCVVKLLREGLLVKGAVCDVEGRYSLGQVPAGEYTLSVSLQGITLSYAEMALQESVELNIGVVPDTTRRVIHLREVRVEAERNKLGDFLITDKHDPRLWQVGFSGGESRDASASVATPADLHPLYGDKPEGLPSYLPKKAVEIYTTGSIQYITPPIWMLGSDVIYAIPTPQIVHKDLEYKLKDGFECVSLPK